MRTFSCLFNFKEKSKFDVIWVGNTKIIYSKITTFKGFKVLIDYAKIKNYIVFVVDEVNEIYKYPEDVFNFSDGFIVFHK